MKKLFYIVALTVIACASLWSCTEEVIKPKESTFQPGGSQIKE
jgi:hypothetical protein